MFPGVLGDILLILMEVKNSVDRSKHTHPHHPHKLIMQQESHFFF